jgi:phosphoribosylaminoimidazole (AIR) synthetase
MKRIIICAGALFLLFVSYAAQSEAESQNAATVTDKVIAEAKKGGYELISPEELKKEYLKGPTAFLLVDTRQEYQGSLAY